MIYRITRITGCFLLGLFFLAGLAVPAPALENPSEYTAEDCMECHMSESGDSSLQISSENYDASVHGKNLTCLECHITITNDTHMDGEGKETVDCRRCHEMETGKNNLISMISSFHVASHKKANFSSRYKMDNCLGCHQGIGSHGETNPINDQNCCKCHDPNVQNAMWGYMHPETKARTLPVLFGYICFAVFILILLLGRPLTIVFGRFPGKNNKN